MVDPLALCVVVPLACILMAPPLTRAWTRRLARHARVAPMVDRPETTGASLSRLGATTAPEAPSAASWEYLLDLIGEDADGYVVVMLCAEGFPSAVSALEWATSVMGHPPGRAAALRPPYGQVTYVSTTHDDRIVSGVEVTRWDPAAGRHDSWAHRTGLKNEARRRAIQANRDGVPA